MEKQKNIYLTILVSLSILEITNIVLVLTNIFDLILFVIFFVVLSILITVFALMLANVIKKIKQVKKEQAKTKSVGDYNIDLYEILGIPVQYNKDGTVKNIYELLGVEPVYDEKGNRVLTIYELLEIMPKFNNNGEEIPTVISIKNRVGRIAKVDVTSRVLTRKLTEEEKEQIAIREALTKKLKEAEAEGDIKKQEAINKIIKKVESKAEKKEEYKPVKYKLAGGGGKAITSPTVGNSISIKNISTKLEKIFDIEKPKVEKTKVENKPTTKIEETTTENVPSEPNKEDDDANKRKCIYIEIEERSL